MDESGFESQTIRPHGYAPIGKPCIDSYNWQGKKRTNVIGALYEKMLFALDYFEHNINSGIFYDWCKHTLIPSLKTKCVIVMDNARFHKSRRIQKLLNRHGHRILWLPPYSPDLNPIEKKWAQVKFLRQGWMENDLSKLFYDVCPSHNTFVLNWLYQSSYHAHLRKFIKAIELAKYHSIFWVIIEKFLISRLKSSNTYLLSYTLYNKWELWYTV